MVIRQIFYGYPCSNFAFRYFVEHCAPRRCQFKWSWIEMRSPVCYTYKWYSGNFVWNRDQDKVLKMLMTVFINAVTAFFDLGCTVSTRIKSAVNMPANGSNSSISLTYICFLHAIQFFPDTCMHFFFFCKIYIYKAKCQD